MEINETENGHTKEKMKSKAGSCQIAITHKLLSKLVNYKCTNYQWDEKLKEHSHYSSTLTKGWTIKECCEWHYVKKFNDMKYTNSSKGTNYKKTDSGKTEALYQIKFLNF